MRNSLQTRLTLAFIGLAILPLLFVGVLVGLQSFSSQQEQVLNLQQQVAQRVSSEVNAFIQERGNELRLLTEVRGLQLLDKEQQSDLLFGLLFTQNVYEELALLDNRGQEKLRFSRLEIITDDELNNRSGMAEFERPRATGETYFSSVWFNETTGEPFMTMSVPLVDLRSGDFTGALVADFRFKAVQDLMSKAVADDSGAVYVVSKPDNRIIAHRNPTVVLQETQFAPPEENGFYPSFDGTDVVMAVENIELGEQDFAIVAEKPAAEALGLAINAVYITVIVMTISLLIAAASGFLIVRQIVRPVEAMSNTARAISRGDLSQQVEVTGSDEIATLGRAFNRMTTQVRELIDTLEQRVEERTQRLETVAALGEQLSRILDVEELSTAVVNQIRENFGYYHAHIYLLDQAEKNLVVAAGTGQAGIEMKRRRHSISVDAVTSLVAKAARTGEIVKVDNVRETEDWLPNPLLPDTYSEMAVPIILLEEVVGVLDVQQNEIAGLDESDVSLLRSLASEVAVAIRNARLFAEVETALAEARAAQEQYVQRAWQLRSDRQFRYDQQLSDVDMLTAAELDQLHQAATLQTQAVVINPEQVGNGKEVEVPYSALVAPIKLQDRVIGTMEFHNTVLERRQQWSEQALALVQAIADQVAQTAENLRLFDETRQRAGREQATREIAEKMQAATDLETLIKIAADELGQYFSLEYAAVELGIETDAE